MYINETDDKCNLCGKQDRATEFIHGDPGSDPRYLNHDYCQVCSEKLGISNCSSCGSIHKASTLDKEYACVKCAKSIAIKLTTRRGK